MARAPGRGGLAPAGLWRRMPPAVFPPLFGLIGLGLAWRRAEGRFALPEGWAAAAAEMLLGAAGLLFAFALVAWAAKPLRRPGVLAEELRILPGQAGVMAMSLSLMLMAAVLAPHAPGPARGILVAGLAMHLLLAGLLAAVLAALPAEARRPGPVFHLAFVGPIIGGLAAAPLGLAGLGAVLLWASAVAAVLVWALSAAGLARRPVPPPLRPLLAIHLAPASVLGSVALLQGEDGLAGVLGWLSAAILAVLAARLRWLVAAGFSPLWGAFTFPLAATAGFWLALGGAWTTPGGLVLVAATLASPPIVLRVLRGWADGTLAARTNAATA